MADNLRILSREKVKSLLESVFKDENITNPKISIEGGSIKGDGYMSFLTKVDVEGNENNLHLMIKAAPKAEEMRKVFPLRNFFLREIFFYNTVINKFTKFEKDRGVDVPINVPKCYKISEEDGNELLVLENIKLKGYRMWNRKTQMNEEHINMVFKQYGRYHAVSYAMKDQNPALFEDITKNLEPVLSSPLLIEIYNKFAENIKNAMAFFNAATDKGLYEKLEKCANGLIDFMAKLENYQSKHSVVVHGDCWCNNMMFNYENESDLKNPKDVCLLDFQVVIPGSPMVDLCYFFHVSATEKILYNYKHHLSIYYGSLKEHYEKLGGNLANLPTFDDLLEQWKIFAKYGFAVACNIFKVMVTEEDEAMDLNDVEKNKIDLFDIFSRKLKNDDVFERMVKVLAKYMYDHEFFDDYI